ncbi:MAG TPA: septation protein IspZ [Caulobacteraceae bacterium]|nr:septation protein IspZ [Caulobacteraceae bacterium]
MTTVTDTLSDAELEGSRVHPIVHAGKWLAADLLSTLMFVGLYAVTHSVYVATGLAVAAGVGQIAYLKLRRARIDVMQWMSLGLVVVFGGASLYAHDPRFIMLKPTLIYAIIGGVMLRRGWMARYQPPLALCWSRDVSVAFGYVWAGLMFATGVLNLVLVAHGDPKVWAWFIGVFPIATKLGLFAVQYAATRFVVVARMRAAGAV